MSKRTLILILALTVVTVLLIYIALSQNSNTGIKQPAKQTSKAISQTQARAETVLSLSPNPLTVSANATSSAINLMVNTNTNSISGAQIELSYDPAKLTNVSVSKGAFLPNSTVLLNRVDNVNGKIFYALVTPGSKPTKGIGAVAIVTFTSLMTPGEQTQIKFFPKSLIIAPGVSVSLLKKTNDATIIQSSRQNTIAPIKTSTNSAY